MSPRGPNPKMLVFRRYFKHFGIYGLFRFWAPRGQNARFYNWNLYCLRPIIENRFLVPEHRCASTVSQHLVPVLGCRGTGSRVRQILARTWWGGGGGGSRVRTMTLQNTWSHFSWGLGWRPRTRTFGCGVTIPPLHLPEQ